MNYSTVVRMLPPSVVHGVLLATLLIGVWEWEALVVRSRWSAWSPAALALGAPFALLMVIFWGGIGVPFAILSVALVANWLLISSRVWELLGSAAVLVAALAQSLHQFRWSARTGLDILFLFAMAVVLALTVRRGRWIGYMAAIYVIVVGLTMTVMGYNHDPLHDLIVSATAALMLAGYIVRRADREQRWLHEVYRAEHDALTDALSRHGLESWLRRLSPRDGGLIVACDLDDFKWLNDTWGHDVGDQVLMAFAGRLRAELGEGDALVRPGGDEFMVWIPGVSGAGGQEVVARLHRAVTDRAYELPSGPIRLGVSMGSAEGPLTLDTARGADQALLVAKRQGKNRVVHGMETDTESSPSEDQVPEARLGWLGDAARALWDRWPTAAVLVSSEGRIVAVNRAYERLTGRSWPELAAKKPGVNSAGETPQEVYRDMWSTLGSGAPWQGTFKNRRPDGTVWRAQERIVPVLVGTRLVGYWGEIAHAPDPDAPPPT